MFGDLVNLASQVGALRAAGFAVRPTRAPFHVSLVQLSAADHVQGRARGTLASPLRVVPWLCDRGVRRCDALWRLGIRPPAGRRRPDRRFRRRRARRGSPRPEPARGGGRPRRRPCDRRARGCDWADLSRSAVPDPCRRRDERRRRQRRRPPTRGARGNRRHASPLGRPGGARHGTRLLLARVGARGASSLPRAWAAARHARPA